MMGPRRGLLGLAGIASAAIALAGCGSLAPVSCTAVGAEPGVQVTFAGNGWKVPVSVEVCVAGQCAVEPSVASTTEPLFVMNRGLVSGSPTPVRVTVRRQGSEALVAAQTTRVAPTTYQPNGPDCEPTVWRASVTVTPMA